METKAEMMRCLCCRTRHAVEYVEREEQSLYKGRLVTYTAMYKYCYKADELISDTEALAANYLALEKAWIVEGKGVFGIDWNGDGVINGFDTVMDLMILDEMEKEDGEEDE